LLESTRRALAIFTLIALSIEWGRRVGQAGISTATIADAQFRFHCLFASPCRKSRRLFEVVRLLAFA
jgi:hypothetical protein